MVGGSWSKKAVSTGERMCQVETAESSLMTSVSTGPCWNYLLQQLGHLLSLIGFFRQGLTRGDMQSLSAPEGSLKWLGHIHIFINLLLPPWEWVSPLVQVVEAHAFRSRCPRLIPCRCLKQGLITHSYDASNIPCTQSQGTLMPSIYCQLTNSCGTQW